MTTTTKSKKSQEIHLVDWENHPSPFYNAKHKRWRKHIRAFVTKELLPNIDKWEKAGDVPQSFYKKCYQAGIYSTFYPSQFGGTPFEPENPTPTPTNTDPNSTITPKFSVDTMVEEPDPFMSIILNEELTRAGSAGLLGAGWIHYIAVPPILMFGSEYLQNLIKPVITADKFASLCISELAAGSDVRNITCRAEKDGNGNYIVNGEKYWITGGMKSDFFITAVRTGKPGIMGLSLLVIPRGPGVTTTRLPLQGHGSSATAYVVFNNCKVPCKNLIGKENEGFKPIMTNFNSERFGIISTAIGLARVCIDESAHYAKTRKTFGKPLIKHQVIRHKLAEMSRRVLASKYFMDCVAYRLAQDKLGIFNNALVKDISLLKVDATKTLEYCAREAAQIFGGRSYIRGGRAGKVERIYRDVRALAIYGGSEEIMLDLAVRQAKL